ncbi:hypothetical protein [Pontibacter sp. G13]|uniref:hypothetical protein n=1 Tax=Pontibacter sp. G13 TaxID=3074898 RepID=UPI00288B3DEC|nr:hypothetical protein [Pontibacter sp. G13]WNJ19439.1 hypothetical protein RJD25_03010 [Pontibacter sp. G13]
MKRPDKLFELVKSMSMSEKRYFKLFAGRHTIGEKNNYLILFDAVDQLSEYDPHDLQESVEQAGISSKHLASDKNYLYKLILKGLSAYHAGKKTSLQIKEELHQAEILLDRGLYDHCENLLKKTRPRIEKLELHGLMVELDRLERKVFGYRRDSAAIRANLSHAQNETRLLGQTLSFLALYQSVAEIRRSISKVRTEKELAQLEDIMQHPSLACHRPPEGFHACLYYWRIWAMYHHIVSHAGNEAAANRALLKVMEGHPTYRQENPQEMLAVLSRLLLLHAQESDHSFQATLKAFREFPGKLKNAPPQVVQQVETDSGAIEMARLLYRGELSRAKAIFPEFQRVFEQYRPAMPHSQVVTYLYLHAYYYIALGDPRSGLPPINELLNDFPNTVRPVMQIYSRLLNLVIHYELKNYSVLVYAADSAMRFLSKKYPGYRVEKLLFRMFKRLGKMEGWSPRETEEWLQKVLAELDQLLIDPFERKSLEYFDSRTWLIAQVESKSFAEAHRAQADSPPPHAVEVSSNSEDDPRQAGY